ncbi:apelin receptor early endogenous ligand [Microcaecilia unicolor]|uniref:Apelin receptor early endogenous ligand n=1 Tax=Microcaecilia unicolor TaxID=1415580 RepID=A0A6P7X5F4_9AMPH|nr:apelin receptor early endogenous ligand [Microcaecilia unicolor]XP_030048537.1 apelin receptor early endogenous ligand [Microcaecilia unicolor]
MRLQHLFSILWVILMSLLLISAQRTVNLGQRRKLHRHNCLQRRCLPLHSRVPFP